MTLEQERSNLSGNLQAVLDVCQSLTVSELLSMAVYMGNKNKGIQIREEWATAIASTLESRCANAVQLN